MIKVVTKMFVKHELIDEYISLVEKLATYTRQKDAGCLSYELYQDLKDPQILSFIEEWEDRAALDGHIAAPHFKEIMPTLISFTEKPMEITTYRKVV